MRIHFVTDRNTGNTIVRGHDGRSYSLEEVDTIRRRAATGDSDARTELANISLGDSDAEARAMFQQVLDDCPECRALRARGEVPIIVDVPGPRDPIRDRRPRWRTLKRRARR